MALFRFLRDIAAVSSSAGYEASFRDTLFEFHHFILHAFFTFSFLFTVLRIFEYLRIVFSQPGHLFSQI